MASAALLQQIQAGKKLKKAETSDRSAPLIANDSKTGSSSTVGRAPPVPISHSSGAAPQLGALFAGGVPKLKPATDRGDQAKSFPFAKPPSIPKRDGSGPAPPPPARSVPPPKPASLAPAPPTRVAPTLPSRLAPTPPNPPALPRRGPSPALPARSAPAVPPRNVSPPALSRPVPAIPPRNNVQAPTLPNRKAPPVPTAPGRAPPPPPPRPSSTGTTRPVPAPPPRKVPNNGNAGAPPPPPRVRALSEAEHFRKPSIPPTRSRLSPPPTTTSRRPSSSGNGSPISPPPRRSPTVIANGTSNTTGRRKIPSPPPQYGPYTFPVSDFPSPREFVSTPKKYPDGINRGSKFDLGVL